MILNKDSIKLKAHAKINLALHITGRRNDGYHLLDSVFLPVGIYDEVTVKKAHLGIKVMCGGNIPEDGRNTAHKAAKLLMDAAGISGVDIRIKKNIPVMAGLGGGSSDAAAVLIGINELYKLGLDKKNLSGMGLKIGADVPFFLGEGAARVRGIGEVITAAEINEQIHMVIIKPEPSLSTAAIYEKYDEMPHGASGNCDGLVDALRENDLAALSGLVHNDLQAAAEPLCPEISVSAAFLKSNGALAAAMTGSGSCVFGIFESEAMARKAAGRYSGGGKAYAVHSTGRPVL